MTTLTPFQQRVLGLSVEELKAKVMTALDSDSDDRQKECEQMFATFINRESEEPSDLFLSWMGIMALYASKVLLQERKERADTTGHGRSVGGLCGGSMPSVGDQPAGT